MDGFGDSSGDTGASTNPSMGTFKSANNIGDKIPGHIATTKGISSLTGGAMTTSLKHSTKGLGSPRPFTAKIKPMKNIGKDIGRKRGY